MRYVKVDALEPGMILAMSMYDESCNVLLRANNALTAMIIARVRTLGYPGLYVFDDNEIYENAPLISEETRIKAVKSLKNLNIDDAIFIANNIVEEISGKEEVISEMVSLASADNYTYQHSVNVNILSVLVGVGMGLKDEELKNLSVAALLHDIGKRMIPKEILNKPEKLTPEELEVMQKHPVYGYELVKDLTTISATVKVGILEHHENEDGTGYPRKIAHDQIHLFAKIIHVVDVYDALTAKRVYKEALNPGDAIEFLMGHSGTMFDQEVLLSFRKFVAPYPVGVELILNGDRHAIVHKNHKSMLTRPIVKLVDTGEFIDLKEVLNVTIVDVVR